VVTGTPSIARTVSSECSPAAAATVPGGGSPRTGRASGRPYMNNPAYTSTANARLNTGPATTMARRRQTLWRLNARCSSSGATGPSRSSSILT
jgi:hypothetical protein